MIGNLPSNKKGAILVFDGNTVVQQDVAALEAVIFGLALVVGVTRAASLVLGKVDNVAAGVKSAAEVWEICG